MKSEILLNDLKEAPIIYFSARDENIAPGAVFGPVELEVYVIECCTDGKGTIIINNMEMPFKAGDIYILQPGQRVVYKSDSSVSRSGLWCALDGISVSKTVSELGISEYNPFLPHELFDDVRSALTTVIDSKGSNDMGVEMRRVGAVYTLLGTLLSIKAAKNKNIWIDKAIKFIETNYYKPLSVDDIADSVGFERCYFSTMFKECTGMSPYHYLNQVRITKAVMLISDKGYSVGEASEMVGVDTKNFARLFKKITGKNPAEFKKKK